MENKITKINLNSLISEKINLPAVNVNSKEEEKKYIPLYKRVDGEIDESVRKFRGEIWDKAVDKKYGSPSNIRRVFITYKGVYVHFYQPVKGSSNQSLKRERRLEVDLLAVRKDLLQGQNTYKITGDVFSRFTTPWVLKNIEEIYFDWSVFLSPDIDNTLGLHALLNYGMGGNSNAMDDGMVKALIERTLFKGNDIQKQFPRLRCVGYLSNLENIYHMVEDKTGTDSLEDIQKIWAVDLAVKAEFANPNSWVMLYYVPGVAVLNKEYSVLTGIYTYDKEVLQPFFEKLCKRIDNIKREEHEKNRSEAVKEVEKEKENPVAAGKVPEKEKDSSLEILKKTWGGIVNDFVKSLMTVYDGLYSSCYNLIPPGGVLTAKGIYRLNLKGEVELNGDPKIAELVYDGIKETFLQENGEYSSFDKYSDKSELSFDDLKKNQYGLCLTKFHLDNLYGIKSSNAFLATYIDWYNKEHAEEISTGEVEKIGEKITRYSVIRPWILGNLKAQVYKIFQEVGVTEDTKSRDVDMLNSAIAKSLKQIMIVSEYIPNVVTTVKVSSGSGVNEVNEEKLENCLEGVLNRQTKKADIKTRTIQNTSIIEASVIYNEKAFHGNVLFAHQVLGDLKKQNIKVGWGNVLLGKNLDNELVTQNFMTDEITQIALYATTGGGKGVMTLNLLGSAMASRCTILYLDAKPDVSLCLGKLAWQNGKEAFVFNGVQTNKEVLEDPNENYCIREKHRFFDATSIPKGMTTDTDVKEQFMMVVTYLRGIELICDLAKERSASTFDTSLPWMVAVLDELQNVSLNEADAISKMIEPHLATARKSKGKGSLSEQEEYAVNFDKWALTVVTKFAGCIRATFRKARMTMIYVWQDSSFPSGQNYKTSRIARCIYEGRASMYKLVGKNFAAAGGSVEFGTPSSLKETRWYDEKFSGPRGGYFALMKSMTDKEPLVFRPFNVYSNTDGKSKIISAGKDADLSPDDLLGVSLYKDNSGDYQVMPEVAFEGYSNSLLKDYGLTAQDQLDTSFRYCENYITGEKGYNSLIDYMYDMHTFKASEEIDKVYSMEFESGTFNPIRDNQTTEMNHNNFDTTGILEEDFGDDFGGYFGEYFTEDSEEKEEKFGVPKNYLKELEEKIRHTTEEDLYDMSPEELEEYLQNIKLVKKAKEAVSEDMDNRKEELINRIRKESGFLFSGKKQSYTRFNTNDSDNAFKVTRENTINCMGIRRNPRTWFGKMYAQTPKGAVRYMKNLFHGILDSVEDNGFRLSMVSRVTICSGDLFFNGKRCDLNGLLGGYENIELKQIVSFKQLFKRCKNIQQLIIDLDILEKAVLEFNDTEYILDEFFKSEKGLLEVGIKDSTGKVKLIKRADALKDISQRVTKESKERNRLEAAMKNTTKQSWGKATFGEDVWGWQLAKGTLGTSAKFLMDRQKPSLVKSIAYGLAGLTVGTVGGALWAGYRVVTSMKNLVGQFG